MTERSEKTAALFRGFVLVLAAAAIGAQARAETVREVAVNAGQHSAPGAGLTVTILPAEAVATGALWRVDGGDWLNADHELTDLDPGYHVVELKPLDTWERPQAFSLRLIRRHIMVATAEYRSLPVYAVGSIPSQTVWHGKTAAFVVRPEDSDSYTHLSFDVLPKPKGLISLDQSTGVFRYTPAPEDKEPLSVRFQGRSGSDAVAQVVELTPTAHLPPEQEVFGLEPTSQAPEPESRDYLVKHTVESAAAEPLNNMIRSVRTVTISGKTVVFQEGHENGLHEFHGNEDIKEMRVYAETVIVRSPLHLPQTDVTMHARELRFEDLPDPAEKAYISTTPRSLPSQSKERAAGADGLKAGDVNVHIESFHSDPGSDIRFVLKGGEGQNGGNGIDGGNPSNMTLTPDERARLTYHLNDPDADLSLLENWRQEVYQRWHCTYWQIIGWKGDVVKTAGVRTEWPADGEPGTPGGKPGSGGEGGHFRSNVHNELVAYVDSGGGIAGTTPDASGGPPGIPNPAIHISWIGGRQNSGQGQLLAWHYSQPGPSAPAPPPDRSIGVPGSLLSVGNAFSWLSPFALKMVVAHAKDSYLLCHVDDARGVLQEYVGLLDIYMKSDDWADISREWQIELRHLHEEMAVLLHRIDSNLDYFGNPPGWVPMLSFEISKNAFEHEIDRAIRTLYLTYWIGTAARDLDDYVGALRSGRDGLKDEIEHFKQQYESALDLIPVLKARSRDISRRIQALQSRLETLEAQFIARAESTVEDRHKVATWRKACKVAGAICKVVPYYQPALAGVGTGLDLISDFDSEDPWETAYRIPEVAQKFNGNQYQQDAEKWREFISRIDLDTIDSSPEGIQQYLAELAALASPMAEEFRGLQDVFKKTQAPRSEVDAELQALRATSSEFEEISNEIVGLLAEKEVYARQLNALVQSVQLLLNGITENLLAVDALNRDINDLNTAFDPRAEIYLKEMEQRSKRRLLKYHYYLARAFEYRMLQPYPGKLDLQKMFDMFQTILTAPKDPATRRQDLGPEDFDSLKSVYEELLGSVAEQILRQFNANRPEMSAWIPFDLSPEELAVLNSGESLILNPKEIGLFLPGEENLRIVGFEVQGMEVHTTGQYGRLAYLDLVLEHSGVSRLQHNGRTYIFRHYNDFTQNPIVWETRFHGQAGEFEAKEPSAASESLLRSLLSPAVSDDDLLMYSRPAGWADIKITKHVNTDNGIDMVIDRVTLKIKYDFMRRRSDQAELDVMVSQEHLAPYVVVSHVDKNGRQDGRGDFRRVYPKYETVTLTAPATYGAWTFQKWTDQFGRDLAGTASTDRVLEVQLRQDQSVRAQYAKIGVPGGTDSVFHRGDTTGDGRIDLTDAISVLDYLFRGGPEPTCREAANANDDPRLDLTDVIFLLNYLFLGGPAPEAPGPAPSPCGPDPETSSSNLGCAVYPHCE